MELLWILLVVVLSVVVRSTPAAEAESDDPRSARLHNATEKLPAGAA